MNFFNCSSDGNLSIPQHKFQFTMRYDVKICRHLIMLRFFCEEGWHGCDILNGKIPKDHQQQLVPPRRRCLPTMCEVFPSGDSAKPTEVGVIATAVEADLLNDQTYRREGVKPPKRWRRISKGNPDQKNNGPKNMEVTDFIQYKLPQIDVRCSSFVHKNLRFFPRNKKVWPSSGIMGILWGAHHHPPIWGLLTLFPGSGWHGGGVVTSNEMFCGDSYENYPKSREGLRESQHICIYHIYDISSIYFIYHIYFLYLYMYRTVSRI